MKKPRGFTLLEVLVAMAVLALLLALLFQIVEHTLRSTRAAGGQLETYSTARRTLDAMDADFLRSVTTGGAGVLIRPDSSGQMNALAFLVHGRGPSASPEHAAPRFLAVSYWWDSAKGGTVRRGYAPVAANSTNLPAATVAAFEPTAHPAAALGDGILRSLILYELNDGTVTLSPPGGAMVAAGADFHGATIPFGWSLLRPAEESGVAGAVRVVALLVVLGVLDENVLARLDASALQSARQDLAAPATPAQLRDVPGFWEQQTASSFPAAAGSGFRAFQKRIPLR